LARTEESGTVTSGSDIKEAPVSPEQFLEMIRIYDRRLRALAFRLLGNRDRMDDALQDSYLKAFRGLPEFRSESQMGTWLYRIVYNTCVDEIRRSARANLVPVPDIEEPDPASDPAEIIYQSDELAVALDELGEQDRALVMLVDGEGFSYQDTAQILDLPIGTVASRLHRARRVLRRSLGNRQSEQT
jgi:RNA polymerase sigma-70 factor (ECF subfamily)